MCKNGWIWMKMWGGDWEIRRKESHLAAVKRSNKEKQSRCHSICVCSGMLLHVGTRHPASALSTCHICLSTASQNLKLKNMNFGHTGAHCYTFASEYFSALLSIISRVGCRCSIFDVWEELQYNHSSPSPQLCRCLRSRHVTMFASMK